MRAATRTVMQITRDSGEPMGLAAIRSVVAILSAKGREPPRAWNRPIWTMQKAVKHFGPPLKNLARKGRIKEAA